MSTHFFRSLVLTASLGAFVLAQGPPSTLPGNASSNAQNKGGNGPGNANQGNSGGVSAKVPGVQWILPETDFTAELFETGTTTVQFTSATDLENVKLWLTPWLKGVTADPTEIASVAHDTPTTITLSVAEPPAHTLAGTLHLQAADGRTLAKPLPIVVKVKGGTGDDGEDEPAVIGAVVNSASYAEGGISAGETVSIFGSGLGPRNPKAAELDATGRVSKYLSDTQVLFNGIPAPLLATSSGQVNAIVPQGIAADTSTSVTLTFRNKVSNTLTIPVTPARPALFALDGSGKGQGAILNQDGTVNSASNPARRGSVIVMFGAGFGATTHAVPDGTVLSSDLPTPAAPVSVTIGGSPAKLHYAGGAPGMVSGIVQINAEVPAGISPGDKVTIVVQVGNSTSPATVTVAVE